MTAVTVLASSAGQTCFAPASVASMRSRPCSRCCAMASSMTMAVSSDCPTPKARPASEITLSVRSNTYSITSVTVRQIGMDRPTSSVARRSRTKYQSTAHRQQDAREQVAGDHVDGLVDEHRGIERLRDRQAHLLELVVAHERDLRLHGIERVENVGVVLLHDLDADGGVAVLQREIRAVAAFHLDRGHVAETHRSAVAPFEHQVRELVDLVAAGEAHRVLAPADVDEAAGHVVGVASHLRDARNLDAELGGARRIEHDLQLFLRAEVDAHIRDPGNGLDAVAEQLLDLPAVVVDGPCRAGQQLHEEPGQACCWVRCHRPRRARSAAPARRAAAAAAGSCG